MVFLSGHVTVYFVDYGNRAQVPIDVCRELLPEFRSLDLQVSQPWSLYSLYPCTGSWSLYCRYSLYGVVQFILPIFPVRGCGVCSQVNRETLLELRSKLWSDAFLSPPLTCFRFEPMTRHAQITFSSH